LRAEEIAKLVGLKYWDPLSFKEPEQGAIGPFGAAKQVLNEAGETGPREEKKKYN
jgi:hypothetical protein